MDVLVFIVLVFGGLYVHNAVKTKSFRKATHMMFDIGDDK